MAHSHAVDSLLDSLGRGRIDVACATDIARAILGDGVQNESVQKLASLGAYGKSQSNSERDLHCWMNCLGLRLQPYRVWLDLKDWVPKNDVFNLPNLCVHVCSNSGLFVGKSR